MQPDPGCHLTDIEGRGRLRDGEAVHRHQFKHGPFTFREGTQELVQFPDPPGGVDPLHQAIDVVGVKQAAARDEALGALFTRGAAELGRDDVARDPVQPRPWTADGPPVPRRSLDDRQEYLRSQVSGQMRIRYPAGHEPGDLVLVRVVELGERGWVSPDRLHRQPGPSSHERPSRRLVHQ